MLAPRALGSKCQAYTKKAIEEVTIDRLCMTNNLRYKLSFILNHIYIEINIKNHWIKEMEE